MSGPDQRVPELVGGVDIRTLPLTAIDGFVFSRIDGRSSVAEIQAITGLPAEQVSQILVRLVELGAARWKGEGSGRPVSSPSLSPPQTFGARTPPPRTPPPRTPPPRRSGPPPTSSTPPRRRPSFVAAQPRRMLSESSISGPPPDVRSFSQRPAGVTPSGAPSRPRTPVPSAAPTPPITRQHGLPSSPRQPASADSAPPSGKLTGSAGASEASSESPTVHPTLQLETPAPRLGAASSEPPLYDPRELEEAVDLPIERRKQILDLYYRLPKLDYYEALGLSYGAEKKQIRTAYFALSRAFHPDSMFRKELGSFKAKMSTVFQYLTEAYETLGKKKTRDEYDAYLRSTRSIAQAERALATDEVAAADANVEVPRPPPLPSADIAIPTPTPIPEPPREATPEARRIAREVLERRLRGAPSPGARRPSLIEHLDPSEREPSLPAQPSRPAIARQLTRALIDAGRTTGNADKLTRLVSTARAAFEQGDLARAVQHMARALTFAPERSDLQREYERLSRMLAHTLAENYVEQARFEAKQGKWASAALSWAKVCEGKPEDGPAHRAAAFALFKAGGDMRGAQKYAQRAVLLAPSDIDARILLAQIYLTVGLKLNAKRELDAAAKLDPENEMVKNLLSELKA